MFLDSLKTSLKKKPTAEGWWTTVMILVVSTFIAYALFELVNFIGFDFCFLEKSAI